MRREKETLLFAKQELDRYVRLITGQDHEIELKIEGDDADFFKEVCKFEVRGGKGVISANRPRALLLGVYAFLRACGCRFLRPGKKGEVIPAIKRERLSASGEFVPVNRHRGIAIEGAVSVENVLELIDWAPKVGFNSYFTQFMNSYEFFERWYRHKGNDFIEKEPIDEELADKYIGYIVAEIKKRSMIYHAVGHGWTTAALGIDCNGWAETDLKLSEDKQELLAMINDKREFYEGKPLNTNLCYSNPLVRSLMADAVVRYVENHPETDVVHFWLGDGFNNVCECEKCAEKSFSDWYVMILNEIDRKLTEKGLQTKICFLIYYDLYWAPEVERIANEDRFIMMFAPIFRAYDQAFAEKDAQEKAEIAYVKNKIEYPHETAPYLTFLKGWQKVFKGDSFDFDYHLMWDINRDLGGEILSRVLYSDIRSLTKMGVNGFISCQLQRAFYPNGFAFYLMGRVLFDAEISYEQIRNEYYFAAFGKYAEMAKEIYSGIEKNVAFSYLCDTKKNEPNLTQLKTAQAELKERLAAFPVSAENEVQDESLAILQFVMENTLRLLDVLILKLEGGEGEALEKAERDRKDFFNKWEIRFQPYADGFYVNMIMDAVVGGCAN